MNYDELIMATPEKSQDNMSLNNLNKSTKLESADEEIPSKGNCCEEKCMIF